MIKKTLRRGLLLLLCLPIAAAPYFKYGRDQNDQKPFRTLQQKEYSAGGIKYSFYQIYTRHPYLVPGWDFNRLYAPPQLTYSNDRYILSRAWQDQKSNLAGLNGDRQLFLLHADPKFRTHLLQPELTLLLRPERFTAFRARLNYMWRGLFLRADLLTVRDEKYSDLTQPLQQFSLLGGVYLLTFPGFQLSTLWGRTEIIGESGDFNRHYDLDGSGGYSRFDIGAEVTIFPGKPVTLQAGWLYMERALLNAEGYIKIGAVIPVGGIALELSLGYHAFRIREREATDSALSSSTTVRMGGFSLRCWL